MRSGGVSVPEGSDGGALNASSAHSAMLYWPLTVSPGSGKTRHLEESVVFQTKKLVIVIVTFVGSLSLVSLILVDLDLLLAAARSRRRLR